jgi:hypothetical protein
MPTTPSYVGGEIWRITVKGHPWQKVSKTPINKLDVVVHACHPSYREDIGSRIVV